MIVDFIVFDVEETSISPLLRKTHL